AGVEPHHHAALAVGDIDMAGGIDGCPLRLDQRRRQPALRRAPREELGSALGEPVQNAYSAIAVERGDEELAAAASAAHLRIDQRRAVEVARLGRCGNSRAAGGNAVHALEVVELACAVPA